MMVQYSKLWHEYLEVAEGMGIITLTPSGGLGRGCRPNLSFCIVTPRLPIEGTLTQINAPMAIR
jgi:hypothetical protein